MHYKMCKMKNTMSQKSVFILQMHFKKGTPFKRCYNNALRISVGFFNSDEKNNSNLNR